MFNIIGMPRSRTAWLANLFTYEGVTCLHDWWGENREPAGELFAYSDSMYHIYYNPSVTAFIHREVDEVMASLMKAFDFPDNTNFDELEAALYSQKSYMERSEGYHIDYRQLEDNKKIAEMWEYLTGVEAPMGHIMRMQNYKITVCYTDIIDAFSSIDNQKESLEWL